MANAWNEITRLFERLKQTGGINPAIMASGDIKK